MSCCLNISLGCCIYSEFPCGIVQQKSVGTILVNKIFSTAQVLALPFQQEREPSINSPRRHIYAPTYLGLILKIWARYIHLVSIYRFFILFLFLKLLSSSGQKSNDKQTPFVNMLCVDITTMWDCRNRDG